MDWEYSGLFQTSSGRLHYRIIALFPLRLNLKIPWWTEPVIWLRWHGSGWSYHMVLSGCLCSRVHNSHQRPAAIVLVANILILWAENTTQRIYPWASFVRKLWGTRKNMCKFDQIEAVIVLKGKLTTGFRPAPGYNCTFQVSCHSGQRWPIPMPHSTTGLVPNV